MDESFYKRNAFKQRLRKDSPSSRQFRKALRPHTALNSSSLKPQEGIYRYYTGGSKQVIVSAEMDEPVAVNNLSMDPSDQEEGYPIAVGGT